MQVVNVGFGSVINAGRIIAVVGSDSAPIKRRIQEARENGLLVDATYGRKTRAVVIMDSGHLVISAIAPETIAGRLNPSEAHENA
jgi:hypothetical protein